MHRLWVRVRIQDPTPEVFASFRVWALRALRSFPQLGTLVVAGAGVGPVGGPLVRQNVQLWRARSRNQIYLTFRMCVKVRYKNCFHLPPKADLTRLRWLSWMEADPPRRHWLSWMEVDPLRCRGLLVLELLHHFFIFSLILWLCEVLFVSPWVLHCVCFMLLVLSRSLSATMRLGGPLMLGLP
jgi:hypothetical protein